MPMDAGIKKKEAPAKFCAIAANRGVSALPQGTFSETAIATAYTIATTAVPAVTHLS